MKGYLDLLLIYIHITSEPHIEQRTQAVLFTFTSEKLHIFICNWCPLCVCGGGGGGGSGHERYFTR